MRTSEITVRLWAAAKHAAGVAEVTLSAPSTVTEVRTQLVAAYGAELARVLPLCSVLVDGQQAGAEDLVEGGALVEFLPPFAGG